VHPEWDGFHLADLVFPTFLFILGVAVPLSISKNKPFKLRNLFRIIALFAIGVFLNIFDNKFNFSECKYFSLF
jgi:heparan-alpha-glucosaminide N-acetyltransferase